MQLHYLSLFVFVLCQLKLLMVVSGSNIPLVQKPITAILPKPHISPNTLPFKDVLSSVYYLNKCPQAEGIIQQKVKAWFHKNYTLAASLIRLHFHDCAVRVSLYHALICFLSLILRVCCILLFE